MGHIDPRHNAVEEDTDEQFFCDVCGEPITQDEAYYRDGLCGLCYAEECALEEELRDRA